MVNEFLLTYYTNSFFARHHRRSFLPGFPWLPAPWSFAKQPQPTDLCPLSTMSAIRGQMKGVHTGDIPLAEGETREDVEAAAAEKSKPKLIDEEFIADMQVC